MNLHENRYGTLGSGPVDRDRERLEHELFVERSDLRIDRADVTLRHLTAAFVAAQIGRLRSALH